MGPRKMLGKVKYASENPSLIARPLNRFLNSHVPPWSNYSTGLFASSDWDNLIILDACRYDLFKERAAPKLPGNLSKRVSGSSSTVEFLQNNIDGRDFRDTVYITANGQIRNHRDKLDVQFHDIVPLYAEEWDDDIGTVQPDSVLEAALTAAKKYPDKRLLIHFVQPHFPFIGSDMKADKKRLNEVSTNFWMRVGLGRLDLSGEELWDAYAMTLDEVIPHVKELLTTLKGKNTVTSDHGNLFGERVSPIPAKEWGHPNGIRAPELNDVPWFEYDNGERKETTIGEQQQYDLKSDPAVVSERLQALGYK